MLGTLNRISTFVDVCASLAAVMEFQGRTEEAEAFLLKREFYSQEGSAMKNCTTDPSNIIYILSLNIP
jgi:hypothetical protein